MVTDRRLKRELLKMIEDLQHPTFISRSKIEEKVFGGRQPQAVRREITKTLQALEIPDGEKMVHYIPWNAKQSPNRVYIKAERGKSS